MGCGCGMPTKKTLASAVPKLMKGPSPEAVNTIAAVQRGVKLMDRLLPGWASKMPANPSWVAGSLGDIVGGAGYNVYSRLANIAKDKGVNFIGYNGSTHEIDGMHYGIYSGDHAARQNAWHRAIARRQYLAKLRVRRKAGDTPGTAHLKRKRK